jgi:Arylsulfotransferase (ASST)
MLGRVLATLFVASFGAVGCSEYGNVLDSKDAGAVSTGDANPPEGQRGPGAKRPRLQSLTVAWSMPPTQLDVLELVPAFSPDVFDYFVRCDAGTNAITVSMTASDGSTSLVVQPTPSRSSPKQAVPLQVNENDAIVAVATDDIATTEYWIRCLPHDMPYWSWSLHTEYREPPPGYYLVGNWYTPPFGLRGYAMILNGGGVPVWYAPMPTGYGVANVDSPGPGTTSFFPFKTGVGPFEIWGLDPLATTTVPPAGSVGSLHELKTLANGNYFVFQIPTTVGVDLSGVEVGLPGDKMKEFGPDSAIADCQIVEFTPAGEPVFTWLASEHFEARTTTVIPYLFGTTPGGILIADVFHCNSLDVDPTNGNLLVSARNMYSVFYIERSTGKVLWKMGGPNSSKDKATYVAVSDAFLGQHDARFQSWSPTCTGGTGQISLFDDHYDFLNPKDPARAVVYDVAVGEPDAATSGCEDAGVGGTGRATLAWQYKGAASSSLAGSFRISADGSRVIGWGLGGAPFRTFTEVDESGNDLLDFAYGDNESSYRAVKVPLSQFDLGVLRRTAGLSQATP